MSTQDVELGIPRDGYPALASWIGEDPDQATFIFRKFTRLSARNLLHLQAQVYELEKQLDDLDKETALGQDVILKMSARQWESFAKYSEQPGPVQERMKLVGQITVKLKEYRQFSLILQIQIWHLFIITLLIDSRRSSNPSVQHSFSREPRHGSPEDISKVAPARKAGGCR